MKHIIILGDGMADWAVKSLGDKTLLQYAKTPYMDKLARMGRNGRLITVADGFHPGSEVANMSVLGYNLPKVYEGRGPLEAASIGVDLQPGEMAMRCNLYGRRYPEESFGRAYHNRRGGCVDSIPSGETGGRPSEVSYRGAIPPSAGGERRK